MAGGIQGTFLFTAASTVTVPAGVDVVETSGWAAIGHGFAYRYDAAVNAAYVTANPRAAFLEAGGRGFRLMVNGDINVLAFGAVGDGVTDDTAAVQAATDYAKLLAAAAGAGGVSNRKPVVYFPAGYIFKVHKVDRTSVSLRGDGYDSRVLGFPGEDIFYWENDPSKVGYQPNLYAFQSDIMIFLDCSEDTSARTGRVGFDGELVGNAAFAFNGTVQAGGSTAPRFENISIRNPQGSANWGTRAAAFYLGTLDYKAVFRNIEASFMDYGLIQCAPSAKGISLDATTDTITSAAHGYANNTQVAILADRNEATLPSELRVRTAYYVVNATTDTFQLSLTSGGAPIAFSNNGSGALFVTKAGASVGPYAPDEWTIDQLAITAKRCGISVINGSQWSAGLLTIHPQRVAARFLAFPSGSRNTGANLRIQNLYTEGPLETTWSGVYAECAWSDTTWRGMQFAAQTGQSASVMIGSPEMQAAGSSASGLDVSIAHLGATGTGSVNVYANRSAINVTGRNDERGIVNDYGSDNRVVSEGRVGAGMTPTAPIIAMDYSLPSERGGFTADWLFTNPSSRFRSRSTLFVPGTYTQPYGVGTSSYSYDFSDPSTLISGFLRILGSVSAAVNLPYWDGRNDTQSNMTVGTQIPKGLGTMYAMVKADQACTTILTVNGATVASPTTMSLTTGWQMFSVRYNATTNGANLSCTIGTPSVSGAERHIQWFCFVPDQELVRTAKLVNTRTPPASATDTGEAGEIAWDSSNVYVCVATNTWKRASLAAW